jgi:deazaflavin-dependent oxidoreductase (nitroreductase family)
VAIPELVFKAMNAIHRPLFDLTGGRIGGRFMKMTALKLTTTGRRSGEPRTVMLTTPVQRGDDLVLVASKGGNDEHPAWYLNLVANPEVTIEMAGRTFQATARTATDEEKAELWPEITAAYDGYGGYQRRTDRDIPVVICTPR